MLMDMTLTLIAADIEFVKCTGKTCRVPRTVSDLVWSPEAIKSLAGQGNIYIRLRSNYESSMTESTEVESPPSGPTCSLSQSLAPDTPSRTSHPCTPTVSSITHSSSYLSEAGPSTCQIDLTHDESPTNANVKTLFPVFPQTSEFLPRERLYDIFGSNLSVRAIDEVLVLCDSDTVQAFKILINGPKVVDLLRLKRTVFFGVNTKKLKIEDKEDILEQALVYYKHPSFNPNIPLRISFKGQPSYRHGWNYKAVLL